MRPSHPPAVLIAEDDPVFRHLLQFTIERAGYTVEVTADGDAAWKRLQSGDIDLLVTDQQMPSCTGIELLLRIANGGEESNQSNPLIRAAILCTAKGLEIDRRRLKEQFGLLEVVGKPFSPKQLVRIIDEFFQGTHSNATVNTTVDSEHGVISAATPTRTVWNACQNC